MYFHKRRIYKIIQQNNDDKTMNNKTITPLTEHIATLWSVLRSMS